MGEALIVATTVFVRGLTIEAHIGLYPHEQDRAQPLVIDADLAIAPRAGEDVTHTVNYERVARHARAIAAAGHIGLVETFAERLARALIAEPRVVRVRLRVEKPLALAPHAAAAGVEIVAERARD